MSPPFPPPQWKNQDVDLYHGTTVRAAEGIESTGIDLSRCSPLTDFGRGFYTTTLRTQAINWAHNRAALAGGDPSLMTFLVDRESLGKLETLFFIRSSFNSDEFWSFIWHCRSGKLGHRFGSVVAFYDLVVGPVAAFWDQRLAIQDTDQISFHTDGAVKLIGEHLKGVEKC
jgi:hypothetical protein